MSCHPVQYFTFSYAMEMQSSPEFGIISRFCLLLPCISSAFHVTFYPVPDRTLSCWIGIFCFTDIVILCLIIILEW